MHNMFKMVSRVVVVVATLALGTSAASAQVNPIMRTVTLNCNNLGAAGAMITSFTWVDSAGTPIGDNASADVSGLNCTGDGAVSKPLVQPVGGLGSPGTFTFGVTYTLLFSDNSVLVTMTSGSASIGSPVRFRDRVDDTANGGKNAGAIVSLGH